MATSLTKRKGKPMPKVSSQSESLANAPRCQAKAKRTGERCQAPAIRGRRTCRVHGSAKGAGGQRGKANGSYKHGGETKEAIALRRAASRLLKGVRDNGVTA